MSRIAVVAKIKAKSEFTDKIREALLSLVEPTTTKDEGCIDYVLHQDNEDPSLFFFLENWESKELLDKHIASEHLQSFLKNTEGMIEIFEVNILSKIS